MAQKPPRRRRAGSDGRLAAPPVHQAPRECRDLRCTVTAPHAVHLPPPRAAAQCSSPTCFDLRPHPAH